VVADGLPQTIIDPALLRRRYRRPMEFIHHAAKRPVLLADKPLSMIGAHPRIP